MTSKKAIKKKEVKKEEPRKNLKQVMKDMGDKEFGLRRYYLKIKEVLEEYMDMDKEHYSLVSLWIVGSYLHKQFPAYPYLFFNAMRGSGKTRMLKIISNLAYNGKVAGSMTEAVLFRTATERTLCIDEFENMNSKGNENLKLLINAAYKRGTIIERMAKKGEKQIVEEFEVYCPIAMANIRGMDNVVGDRCLSVILEKSSKIKITKLIENFEYNLDFEKIRGGLKRLTERISPTDNIFGSVMNDWNIFIKNEMDSEISKGNTYGTYGTYAIDAIFLNLFKRINSTNISGRDLELFLPLFIISDICGEDILKDTLKLSQKVVKEKKEIDREENKDVKIYEYIAQLEYVDVFVNIADIADGFSNFFGEDPKYNTPHSMSRALNRLKLILEKRNTGKKRQVKLNISKAKEKLGMFKEVQDDNSVSLVSSVSSVSSVNSVSKNNNNNIYNKDPLSKFTKEEIEQTGYTKEELEKMVK